MCAQLRPRYAISQSAQGCAIVRRKGRLYVVCEKNPKHKQVRLRDTPKEASSHSQSSDKDEDTT
jgi:large subunit ribosomal protein L36